MSVAVEMSNLALNSGIGLGDWMNKLAPSALRLRGLE